MKKLTATLLALALVVSAAAPASATNVSDLKQRQQDVQQKTNEAQGNLNTTRSEKNNALGQLELADAELDQAVAELEAINKNLDEATALLERTEIELEKAIAEKDKQYDMFKKRLRFMYVRGKSGYLDIIFNAQDFSELINRIEYINRIVTYDQDIFTRLQAAEELVAQKLDETRRQRNEIQVLADMQTAKTESLEVVVADKQQIVRTLEANEARYSEMVKNLDNESKQIASMIQEKQKQAEEAARRAAAGRSSSGGGAAAGSYYVENPYSGGALNWPVPGSGNISSGYGPRTNPISGKSEFHNGIDIPARSGTPIAAAEGGVVISAGTRGGYGKTVIVDHGNGLTTLYAHCSSIDASVGQKVGRGETIARVGTTGYSTGNHLHFTVMQNGGAVSPMSYLK